MVLLRFAITRLREPSTYAGLGGLLLAAGVHLTDAQVSALVLFLAAAFGLLAVFLPEKK